MTELISQGITLMIVGMGVVFLSLAIMAYMIEGLRRLGEEAPPPADEVSAPVAAPNTADSDTPNAELLAILTAAAYAVVRKPVRIRQVVILGHTGGAWVSGGRATIMGSHRPHLNRPRTQR